MMPVTPMNDTNKGMDDGSCTSARGALALLIDAAPGGPLVATRPDARNADDNMA